MTSSNIKNVDDLVSALGKAGSPVFYDRLETAPKLMLPKRDINLSELNSYLEQENCSIAVGDDFIFVSSTHQGHLLTDSVVKDITLNNVTAGEAIFKIAEATQVPLSPLGLSRQVSHQRFSVDVNGLTVREALIKIAGKIGANHCTANFPMNFNPKKDAFGIVIQMWNGA
jgi:hypothetical protein